MKRPKLRCGKLFAAVTAVYMLLSLFGSILYLKLPPFLCSIGARVHAYLLYEAIVPESAGVWRIVLAVAAHVLVLGMVVLGIVAMVKGQGRVYVLLLALEILGTVTVLLLARQNVYHNTGGIAVNAAYFVWAYRTLAISRGDPKVTIQKKKGSKIHGKL